MSFLQDKCSFGFYTREKVDLGQPFSCGDEDLNEFFIEDAFLQSDALLCKNYCFTLDAAPFILTSHKKKRVATNLTTLPIGDTPIPKMEHVHCSVCKDRFYFFLANFRTEFFVFEGCSI
jgi:hypothetical protein